MTLLELIDAAKRAEGSLGAVAKRLGVNQVRISYWKAGTNKPDADTIAQLAEMAGLPVFETLAEVQAELHPEVSKVWERALGKLRATGVAATIAMMVVTGAISAPTDANAKTSAGSVYYVK